MYIHVTESTFKAPTKRVYGSCWALSDLKLRQVLSRVRIFVCNSGSEGGRRGREGGRERGGKGGGREGGRGEGGRKQGGRKQGGRE